MNSYRDVDVQDMNQERDIFLWQGMTAADAFAAAKRNAIDRWRKWEARVLFGGRMGNVYSDVDEGSICDGIYERDIIQNVLNAIEGRELDVVTKGLQGYNLKEVGAQHGFGESWACRVRGAAIKRLRRKLRGDTNGDN